MPKNMSNRECPTCGKYLSKRLAKLLEVYTKAYPETPYGDALRAVKEILTKK